ncbi:MAG: hypothetical protein HONBIEJF_00157 [Fimbriimonadaceae bacterium]|nr:hypothetical protein [Fimbriimonadaceae bacterium]
MDERPDVELPQRLSVYDVIQVMCDQMASIAWQKLGLQPDPISGKIERDMEEAKVAIDLTTHLASFIQPLLEEADQRRLHSLIRDLRLNFVEKSNEAGT